jgi:hypothetical protein
MWCWPLRPATRVQNRNLRGGVPGHDRSGQTELGRATSSPRQIPVDTFIGEEINKGLDLQPRNIKLNRVAKSLHPSRSGPEGFRVTGLNLKIQLVRMFALKEAIARTGLNGCEKIVTFAGLPQDNRQ